MGASSTHGSSAGGWEVAVRSGVILLGHRKCYTLDQDNCQQVTRRELFRSTKPLRGLEAVATCRAEHSPLG